MAEWRALPDDRDPSGAQQFALVRDVPAGELVSQSVWLTTPATPGDYDLVVHVAQTGGAWFDEPLRQRLTIGSS